MEGVPRRLAGVNVGVDTASGLLAYRDGEPVGWVAVSPRAEFSRVMRQLLS